jgi:predicted HicB family RNase H-like nuclease
MSEKNKQFQVWLPPELKSRLKAAAKLDRRSMNNFVGLAIETACVKVEQQGNNHAGDRKNA